MKPRVLITAGLPYANGSLHLGHLLEYCQADMYARALQRLGERAIYLCGSDAHGTPIELNAKRRGIAPQAMVEQVRAEHLRDFARFDVAFDHFGSTHSATNKGLIEKAFAGLQKCGEVEQREVLGNYCETDGRFLPDRFIKGTCPRCGAAEQYGDVCEACGATYAPTELVQPHCVLCGQAPKLRPSQHLFFKLSAAHHEEFLRKFIDSGALQPDIANYVRSWCDGGLRDWCISRDGPYFGFAIPGHPQKYFYVWLDAPFGYMAAAQEYAEMHGLKLHDVWNEQTRIEHIIGKDIAYFHTLFWPAVLHSLQLPLPCAVHVHGMLTVDGEKMSKSRGTFINAALFAEHVDPQALRYYFASKYSATSEDMDLSLADFLQRINTELVNKHVNLFSRAAQFVHQKLGGTLGDLPFTAAAAQAAPQAAETSAPADLSPSDQAATEVSQSMLLEAQKVVACARRIEQLYRRREFAQVVRELGTMADVGNEWMQARKPWEQLKASPEAARQTCTFVLNVCHALAMYLWPIVPRLSDAAAKMLGVQIESLDAGSLFNLRNQPLGPLQRLFERLEPATLEALTAAAKAAHTGDAAPIPTAAHASTKSAVQVSSVPLGNGAGAAPKGSPAASPERPHSSPPSAPLSASSGNPCSAPTGASPAAVPQITYDHFAQLTLRLGTVVACEPIPKSKKLLKLLVDVGEAAPRQIVAGLALAYAPADLLHTQVIVLTNLAPVKLMGCESCGMVLAAGSGAEVRVLRPDASATAVALTAGTVVK
jgi:methionyl-tRNA synthetase